MSVIEDSRRSPDAKGNLTIQGAIKKQMHVMHAVILRDIRSRYFNHGLGFLIVPLLPVAHVAMLLIIYKVLNRESAFGEDLVLFFATGLIPALTAIYISRYMSVSVVANKSMLAFPAVHLLDIILARSALELFAIIISIIFLIALLVSLGVDPVPRDMADVMIVIAITAFLGLGVGMVVSVLTAIFPFFAFAYSLFTALIYLTSGGPIYLHTFPEQVIYIASFNPVFHAVEWMRSAYYLGYPTQSLDKQYLLGWTSGSVVLGLLMERVLRRHILNS